MSTVTSEEVPLNRNEILRAALRCVSKAESAIDCGDSSDEESDHITDAIGYNSVASMYLEVANAISRPTTDFIPSRAMDC